MINKYNRLIKYIVVFIILSLSIGYSAFNNELVINDIKAKVRIKSDIRVTGLLYSKSNNAALPQYEEYNYNALLMNIRLPNPNSTITYKVSVTNFGNQEMGIFELTNLQENLTYEVEGYKLRDKICSNATCTLGTTKDFYITIKYKENGFNSQNTEYNIRIELDFRKINTITYKGIVNNGYPTYIMDGDDLKINIINQVPPKIITYSNGVKLAKNLYSYQNSEYIYNKVTGNVILEYVEKVYLATLPEGSFFKQSEHINNIKKISFVEHVDMPPYVKKIYDLSEKKDGNILGWIDNDYNLYIGSEWKIYSKDLSNAFYQMSNVETISFDNLNTSETTNMYYMFGGMKKLTTLDLKSFNTSNVTNMGFMFSDCNLLTNIDLSSLNTSKVTTMRNMFANLNKITSLNLGNFDTSNVTMMNYMFQGCNSLVDLNIKSFDTSKVTNMYAMFYDCMSLTNLDLSNFNTANVTVMQDMFMNSTSLQYLNLSNFNTSKVQSMKNMFNNCISLKELDIKHFDTRNVTNMQTMFINLSQIKTLDLSSFITTKVENMYGLFRGCSSLEILDLSNFDVSLIDTTAAMFMGCSNLKELYITNFNTINVKNMHSMFEGCASLTKLDVSNLKTSKVTNFKNMFYDCILIEELDVSNFDTTNATNMQGMFFNMQSVKELDVSNFKTEKVTSMEGMFSECSSLKNIDVSKFNTSLVTTMYGMFKKSGLIEELDLSSFDTSSVTSTAWMFEDMLVKTIYVSDKWNMDKVTDSHGMFDSIYNIVGGNGTVYTYEYTDKTYARIDQGPSLPGYFTYKESQI